MRFYDFAQDVLDEWKPRVRDEVAEFLRHDQPIFHDFAGRALNFRISMPDDRWMRTLLKSPVSTAFVEWLEPREIPGDVALRPRGVYAFDFSIRDND